ncbi:MAG: molybdopterin dinucleotide binding domain-containing protein, partial [Cyanobacteria bacterium P01_C01_bin.73]
RLYGHWHTQSRTGRIEKMTVMHPNAFMEISPRDAQKLEIQSGNWVEVRSRRGRVRLPALVTANIRSGTVYMPMHWGALWADDAECNAVTHSEVCPISLQPELKACAVQIVPVRPKPHPELNEQTPQDLHTSTLPTPRQSTMLSASP